MKEVRKHSEENRNHKASETSGYRNSTIEYNATNLTSIVSIEQIINLNIITRLYSAPIG